ncbi:carbon-nitrogen hydrolase family protein [Mycobacterium hodleri]|uniref:carbon-nitrogen hydrolase family protein n=1 Tax=Mycolicibacterium hodleri TaxID=49897 RepID=UPI0021F2A970|nr:carbon-nitrogen hydrolase family protein [Mycolicibacterium hodleri]MCV7132261.1 carbon-nitrogen hydrolase family protein [Mycolicibacterium hodleri]
MRIALAQIQSSTDPAANLGVVEDFGRRAAEAGAAMVLFPEATMCRFGVSLKRVAEPLDGRWASGVRSVAERAGIVVVAGMFCPGDDGRVTNTLLATGPGVEAHYHKIHLYDAFGFNESRTVAPGFDPVLIDVDGVAVGLTTCYDIRFPEQYVELAQRGARVLTVHASWGSGPGKLEQWTLLARARAIDATSIVAAVGQAYPGDDVAAAGPTGVGGSMVCSPTGDVVAAAGADPHLLVVDVDLDSVQQARDTVAVLRNRTEFAQSGRAQSLR